MDKSGYTPLPDGYATTTTYSATTYPVSAPQPASWPDYGQDVGQSGAPPATGVPVPSSVTVSIPDTVVVVRHDLSVPQYCTCAYCKQVVLPEPRKESGACTWLVAAGLCVFGCWCCSFVPFCCNSTKDNVFHCPNCGCELYRVRAP